MKKFKKGEVVVYNYEGQNILAIIEGILPLIESQYYYVNTITAGIVTYVQEEDLSKITISKFMKLELIKWEIYDWEIYDEND